MSINPRRSRISRAAVVSLATCLLAGAVALPGSAASNSAVAGVAKKCKKRKHHQKKRRCKRPMALSASIAISPMSQDFAIVHLPQGPTRSFVITNTGGSPSGLPVPSVTGSNPESFGVVANGCAASLGPGLTCQIDVDLLPQGHGPVSATLSVTAVPGGVASATMTGRIEA